ncbi:MAG: HAD family phosphatase [Chloroflexi bacterium]|nr:HAD family phosphatase [Chloroflexota bacterium]
MDYKLLAVDIDGTLVDKKSFISPADRDALEIVRRAGIRIALSTGRSVISCARILNQLTLDGFHIFFDGALVANPGNDIEVYAQPLSPEVVKQAVAFSHATNLPLDLYSAKTYFVEADTWSAAAHREFFSIQPTFADFNGIWERERIIKIGLVVTSPGDEALIREFASHFDSSLHLSRVRTPAYPAVDFINVVSPGVSKGKALEVLAAHLGIPMDEVMAIGDGLNDLSLLSVAGLSIAMGDAPDEVKAVADHITLDVNHSGFAEAVGRFVG